MTSKKTYSYKDAGVDIAAGNDLVTAIKPAAAATTRPGCNPDLGGFGALFDLKATGYRDPVLVSGTDGVGTKLKIAIDSGRHDTIGIDLVAMCVNDLIVQGAEPLFFLDYFATGHLSIATGQAIIAGIAKGCREAGTALIGGETAEMPGLYAHGDYDLAGFCVGAVERDHLLTGQDVSAGDVILGLASSGIHANGFSLVRRLVTASGCALHDPCPFDPDRDFAEVLLTPTRIYVKSTLAALKPGHITAICHITGGGFVENIPRILPKGATAHINAPNWPLPPVFHWLREAGNLEPLEMARTFNCGIGLVVIVRPEGVDEIREIFRHNGETVYTLGRVVKRSASDPATIVTGPAGSWGYTLPWQAVSTP